METNLSYAARKLLVNLSSRGTTIGVLWTHLEGGTLNVPTGAMEGAVETLMSGTLKGFTHQTESKMELRRYREIQAGDLLVDLPPDAEVTVWPGQIESGTLARALDDLPTPRFIVDGELYAQAEIGEGLAGRWRLRAGDQALLRTILLRKAT